MHPRLPAPWLALAVLLGGCHCNQPADKAAGLADAASAPADAGPPVDAGPPAAQIIEAGAEPRAVVSFAFVPGRREARILSLDSLLEGKSTNVTEQLELRFEVRYTAADTVELTLRHVKATAVDIEGIPSTVGMRVVAKIGKDGTLDPPQVVPPPSAQKNGDAAEYVKGAILQGAATFLPPVPPSPIGEGARWRFGDDGPVCRLVSRRDGKLVVERTLEIHGRRRLDNGRPADVEEEQSARIEAPVDGIAQHVESKLVLTKNAGKLVGTKRTTHLRFEVTDAP